MVRMPLRVIHDRLKMQGFVYYMIESHKLPLLDRFNPHKDALMQVSHPIKAPISILMALILGTIAVQANAQAVRAGGQPSAMAAQQRTVPGFYRLMLGKFEITALSDGTVKLPLDKLLSNTTAAQLQTLHGRAGNDPRDAETSINAFLIHTGERLVLIDTGAGSLFPTGGRLVQSLAAAGYVPEDITDVMITHIHGDHSAGLSRDGKRVFPNATVHVEGRDADFWLDAGNAAKHPKHADFFAQAMLDLGPYQDSGRVRRFSAGSELVAGIRAVPAPGHTPGHSLYAVESEGKKLLLWGDLIHDMEAQFHTPGVAISFDVDQTAAIAQRKLAMKEAAAKGYLVGAAHISFPGIGRVLADGKAYRWLPVTYSETGLTVQPGRR